MQHVTSNWISTQNGIQLMHARTFLSWNYPGRPKSPCTIGTVSLPSHRRSSCRQMPRQMWGGALQCQPNGQGGNIYKVIVNAKQTDIYLQWTQIFCSNYFGSSTMWKQVKKKKTRVPWWFCIWCMRGIRNRIRRARQTDTPLKPSPCRIWSNTLQLVICSCRTTDLE